MTFGLSSAVSAAYEEAEDKQVVALLGQWTDDQLERLNRLTGALPPQLRQQIAEYRQAQGPGYILGRMVDFPMDSMSHQEFKTYCFGIVLAYRCMTRWVDPLISLSRMTKGTHKMGISTLTTKGTRTVDVDDALTTKYPSIAETWSDVDWTVDPERVRNWWFDSTTTYQVGSGDALCIIVAGELGLPFELARATIARAMKDSQAPAAWKSAIENYAFTANARAAFFWYALAREAQSVRLYQVSAEMWENVYSRDQIQMMAQYVERGGPLVERPLNNAESILVHLAEHPEGGCAPPEETGFPWAAAITGAIKVAKKLKPVVKDLMKKRKKVKRQKEGQAKAAYQARKRQRAQTITREAPTTPATVAAEIAREEASGDNYVTPLGQQIATVSDAAEISAGD